MNFNFILKKIENSLKKEIPFLDGDSISEKNFFQFVTIPKPSAVVFPENKESLSCILKICCDEEVPVVIKGAGSDIWDKNFNCENFILIDMTKLGGFKFHKGDTILETLSGSSFYKIQKSLMNENFYIPFNPFFSKESTIGGAYSYSPASMLSGLYGGMEDLVTGVDFVTSDGTIYSFGGKCIKNVTGYDLPAFMANTEANLAVVVRIFLKTLPYKNVKELYKISGDTGSLISFISYMDEEVSVVNYKLLIPEKDNTVLYLELDDNLTVISEATGQIKNGLKKFQTEKLEPDKIIPFANLGREVFCNILTNFSSGTIIEMFIDGYFPLTFNNQISKYFEGLLDKCFVTGSLGRYYFYCVFKDKFNIGNYREFLEFVSEYYGKITKIKSSDTEIKEHFKENKIFRWYEKIKKSFDEKTILF